MIRGTADKLGVGVECTGLKVECGLSLAVLEGITGEDAEVMVSGVVESAPTAAIAAACFFCSPLTPTATPTMILMTIRATRIMIAMPLFVLYQRDVYEDEGAREGESAAIGCEGSSLSRQFVAVGVLSMKGFGPWF